MGLSLPFQHKHIYHSRRLFGLIIFFFLSFFLHSLSANEITFKSDFFQYNELTDTIVLKDNVSLRYNDVVIEGNALTLLTQSNQIISTQNVSITRDGNTMDSSSLFLDLDKESVSLTQLQFAMTPDGLKDKLYVSIQSLTQYNRYQSGKWGFITTCDLSEKPHHYVKAWRFRYYPDKYIAMYLGIYESKFLFFPFNLIPFPIPLLEIIPIPYYRYSIGKRRVVWTFPTISKKDNVQGWGWILQNSFDYRSKNGDESSVYLDWYETNDGREGNWGYGIKHHYQSNKHEGSIYAYNYSYKDIENDTLENKQNMMYYIDHSYYLSHFATIDLFYKKVDVEEKINSNGSDRRIEKSFHYDWDKHGNTLSFLTKEHQNFIQNNQSLQFKLKRKYFGYYNYDFNLDEKHYYNTFRRLTTASFSFKNTLFNDYNFTQKFNFQNENYSNDTLPADEFLKSYSTLTKTFDNKIKLTVKMDHFYDLDSDSLTTDSSGGNNFFYRTPEVTIEKKSYTIYSIKQSTTLTFGHYREIRYQSSDADTHLYPNFDQFFLEPNVYHFNHDLSRSFKNLPLKTSVSFNAGYDQYLFKNDGFSLFESDAQYSFNFGSNIHSTLLNFLKLTTAYSSRYAPIENNSPFYHFKKSISEQNSATGSATLFYKNSNMTLFPYTIDFSFKTSTGFNWIRETKQWNDFQYELSFNTGKSFNFKANSSQKVNYTYDERRSIYTPLIINIKSIPFTNTNFNYDIIIDLNDWVFQKNFDINSSSFYFDFPIGRRPDYQWSIKTYFSYDTRDQPEDDNAYDFSLYQMQSLSIVKREHKRTLEVGFKKTNDEIFIKYNFTLFPEDPIVIRKKEDIWSFEGRLKQSTVERFK